MSAGLIFLLAHRNLQEQGGSQSEADRRDPVLRNAERLIDAGREIFRYDTFGDEAFWGGSLKLHEAIRQVSPRVALSVGLKVDVEKLPPDVQTAIRDGKINIDDPAVTQTLLKLGAVVGATGFFDKSGSLNSMGIQCALCHSTVDDSLLPGIGRRRDGWPNRDLNVGAIIALAPDLSVFTKLLEVDDATVRLVLRSWGPGKFDSQLSLDGKAFRPDGKPAATLIPAAFGMGGVNLHTYTGWRSVSHWNALVAVLEMHGQGTFYDPRLNDKERFPVAAKAGFGNVRNNPDLVTPKLAALQMYQLALPVPKPEFHPFNFAATRGKVIFENKAQCAQCHVPPIYTEPGWNMHTANEICIDDFQSNRSPDRAYRTTPLGGLQTREKGGFYHDGRFKTLGEVVDHYNSCKSLRLLDGERNDLVEYLKTF
ncbi:MAG: hypothetical protein JJE04_02820 [Acidobacteriia bacterium]|nr:hypothetical protein [Terriglobia bacterium]